MLRVKSCGFAYLLMVLVSFNVLKLNSAFAADDEVTRTISAKLAAYGVDVHTKKGKEVEEIRKHQALLQGIVSEKADNFPGVSQRIHDIRDDISQKLADIHDMKSDVKTHPLGDRNDRAEQDEEIHNLEKDVASLKEDRAFLLHVILKDRKPMQMRPPAPMPSPKPPGRIAPLPVSSPQPVPPPPPEPDSTSAGEG